MDGLKERIVLLFGTYDNVVNAALQVCKTIQNDPHLAEHQCLKYDIKLPMGTWAGARATPDPGSPLMTPQDARLHTKRQLLTYLRKSAPREIVMRLSVFGSINEVVKHNNRQVFVDAVAENYVVRQGHLSNPPDDTAAVAVAEVDSLSSLDASDPCETEESDWLSDTSDSLEELMSMSACSDSSTVASLTQERTTTAKNSHQPQEQPTTANNCRQQPTKARNQQGFSCLH